MLRLTPRRSRRVPYALAIFGALLFAAGLLAGTGRFTPPAHQQAGMQPFAGDSARETGAAARLEGSNLVREAAVTSTRKFRVNLFLFRH
jgi:hypothetical protein